MKKLLALLFLCGSTCILSDSNSTHETQPWTLAHKTTPINPDVMITQAAITAAGAGGYIISTAGTYALSQDVTSSATTAIKITVSDVLLDLNGHTLTGAGSGSKGIAITASSLSNIYICYGKIVNCSGFTTNSHPTTAVVLDELQMQPDTSGTGIDLDSSANSYISNCSVNGNTSGSGIILTGPCKVSSCQLTGSNITASPGTGQSIVIEKTVVTGTSTYGFDITSAGGNCSLLFCEALNNTDGLGGGAGFYVASGGSNTTAYLYGCRAPGGNDTGFMLNNCEAIQCYATTNTLGGFTLGSGVNCLSCVSSHHSQNGFTMSGSDNTLTSCISFANVGYNYSDGTSPAKTIVANCIAYEAGATNYHQILGILSNLFDPATHASIANYWMNASAAY